MADENTFDFNALIDTDSGSFVENWTQQLPDDLKTELGDSKAFANIKTPRDLLKTTIGNSKLAGRALLPKDDAPDEEWDKVYQVGVPKEGEGYGLSGDGLTDEALKAFAEKTGYLEKLERVLARAGVPKRLAAKIATADAVEKSEQLRALEQARDVENAALIGEVGGQDKYDAARLAGRDALARLYGEAKRDRFERLVQKLDAVGLADDPDVIEMTHLMAQRISPGQIAVGKSSPAATQVSMLASVLPNTAKALGIK